MWARIVSCLFVPIDETAVFDYGLFDKSFFEIVAEVAQKLPGSAERVAEYVGDGFSTDAPAAPDPKKALSAEAVA